MRTMIETTCGPLQLRDWQARALNSFATWLENRQAGDSRTWVASVVTAAGKTLFAAEAARRVGAGKHYRYVVVVAPSLTILQGWQRTFDLLGVRFDSGWQNGDDWPDKIYGIGVTYQQVAVNPDAIRQYITPSRRTLLILDEVHHAGESVTSSDRGGWADAIKHLGRYALRLLLSGTLYRSDDKRIPYATYDGNRLKADFTYSYEQALTDGIVRPLKLHFYDGIAAYSLGDAQQHIGARENNTSQWLNSVIAPESNVLRAMLDDAHEDLRGLWMTGWSMASGIVVAKDQAHARAIAALSDSDMQVITSSEDNPHQKLEAFRDDGHWAVGVKMFAEGWDAPRTRCLVWASNITTQWSFEQAIGRVLRTASPTDDTVAHASFPSHPAYIEYAKQFGAATLHELNDTAPKSKPGQRATRNVKHEAHTLPDDVQHTDTDVIAFNPQDDPVRCLAEIAQRATQAIAHMAQHGRDEVHARSTLLSIAQLLPMAQAQHERQHYGDSGQGSRGYDIERRLTAMRERSLRAAQRRQLDAFKVAWQGMTTANQEAVRHLIVTRAAMTTGELAACLGYSQSTMRPSDWVDTGFIAPGSGHTYLAALDDLPDWAHVAVLDTIAQATEPA